MSKRYENWKELKPLTAPAEIGTKCVVISDYKSFSTGDVVTPIEDRASAMCENETGARECMTYFELALLPSEEPAKAERKIVSSFCDLAGYVHAVCDDGTMWYLGKGSEPKWYKTPPIPQDAV